jgi:acetyltransferase
VLLRPIKPEDEPMWLEMFQSFSDESIRYRFFQMVKDTPHEVRVRYCNIDYDREIALVAELTERNRKRILGVSRLSIEPDGKSGELAFIVGDQWQGLGLGTKLVDYTLEIAKEMKIEKVYAIMLPDNNRALNLTKKMGFKLEYLSDGTVKGLLDLKEEILEDYCPKPSKQQETPEAEKQKKLAPKEKTEAKEETKAASA